MATLFSASKLSSKFSSLLKPGKFKERPEENLPMTEESLEGWEQLPALILEKIVQQLNLPDSVRMSVVCKSWRSIIKRMDLRNNQAPWLMLPLLEDNKHLTFFDLSESRFYNVSLPKAVQGSWCCGSSKGWLIMAKGHRSNPKLKLYNPISGVQLSLPSLQTIPFFGLYNYELRRPYNSAEFVTKIELSSANAEDCVVAGIFDEVLALCRLGDKEWTIFEEIKMFEKIDFFSDILFTSDGILLALISSLNNEFPFQFGVHSLRIGDKNPMEVTLKVIPNRIFSEVVDINWEILDEFDHIWVGRDAPGYSYLVESDGELMIVQRIMDIIETDIDYIFEFVNLINNIDEEGDDISKGTFLYDQTNRFEVLKVDNLGSNMSLRRLYNLGDRVIFVSSSSASVSSSARNLNGLKKNCIFFLDNLSYSVDYYDPLVSCESGVFYVGDGKIERSFPSMQKSSVHYRMNWF